MIIPSDTVLNISYSKLSDIPLPWNTAELYEFACQHGFDGIKGDVTPSLDHKLIMCHDDYFSFDENGRVLEPGKQGIYQRKINELHSDECKQLEYARPNAHEYLGYYARVTELEDLIRICKKYGKFPYITVRDQQIELCVEEILRLLRQDDMTDRCIINSFTPDTLWAMRRNAPNMALSYVWGPDIPLTRDVIDTARALGNCAVCAFIFKEAQAEGSVYEQSRDAIAYAKKNRVVLHLAHGADRDSYRWGLERGFMGFQCLRADAIL